MRSAVAALAFAGVLGLCRPAVARAESPAPLHGALVMALGSGAETATKSLAREVYHDKLLRPDVDDATARVLAGDPAAEDAPDALKSLAQVRVSLPVSADDLGAKLVAAIGEQRHAELVVVVSVSSAHPVARIVRVRAAKYEPLLIESTPVLDAGDKSYTWPGVTTVLHQLVTPPEPVVSPAPIVPKRIETPPVKPVRESSSWYKSPWFWGPLGAVVVTGAAIFIASQVTSDDVDTIRLRGRVAP